MGRTRGKTLNAKINARWGTVVFGEHRGADLKINHYSPRWGAYYGMLPDGTSHSFPEKYIANIRSEK